jgi:hypothetical protein
MALDSHGRGKFQSTYIAKKIETGKSWMWETGKFEWCTKECIFLSAFWAQK